MKTKIQMIIGMVLALSIMVTIITGCGTSVETYSAKNEEHVITDMSGNEIVLPDKIETYAVAWAGLTDILLMLDGTDHLSAYPEKSASFGWIFEVYPEYNNKICLSNDNISSEEIIELGVDIVFMKAADDEDLYTKLNECGIATVDCQFDTYEELKTVVSMIAEILGTEKANQKAEEYNLYLDNAVSDTRTFSEKLDDNEKISALVMKDTKDYSAYGSERYTGKWVELCGANYSMINEDAYANVNLTKEQIIEYNPDYIFFAMPNQAEGFIEDATWSELTAVKNGHVYNIPGGFNTWSNCGAESALVFRWAASVMYPEQTDFDIKNEVKTFYSQFYGYEPTEDEIEKVLLSAF